MTQLSFTASLLFPAFLALQSLSAKPSSEPSPVPPANPFSLLDGRLVLDVSARGRFEFRENTFDFNSRMDTVNDDAFLLQRFRIGLTVRSVDWLTVRVQAQDAREIGSDRANAPGVLGAEGDDPFDLRLFSIRLGDMKAFPATLELGRQALNYGDQRLIGAFEWNNIGRVFDAAVLRWESGTHRIDLFTASVVVPDRDGFNQSWFTGGDTRQALTGIYYTTATLACQTTDLYALWQSAEGGTDFATLGTRWQSKPGVAGGLDYNFESALQLGEVRGSDLRAGAVHIGAGHTWDHTWKPRLGVAWDYGSGDKDAADAKTGTFQNLYPTNHLFYGYMDAFAWQNINSPSLDLTVKPCSSVTLRAAWHVFWLATTNDAWYRANGTAQVRPITPPANSYAGQEIDLTVAWKLTPWADALMGYSHFFASDYLNDTGSAADAGFFYIQAGVSF